MTEKCRWCGMLHEAVCPKVKAIEYAEDGVTVKRVEFLVPTDYAAISGIGAPIPAGPSLGPGFQPNTTWSIRADGKLVQDP